MSVGPAPPTTTAAAPGSPSDAPRRRPRLLLASPHLPYPKASVANDGLDVFYYRNTFAQGPFQLRQEASWHPLHYLAQNLPVDAVVLEHASRRRFQREVARGGYQVVAISFTVPLAEKVLEQVTWLRAAHPEIEIVLGGYGTVIFDEDFGIEKEIAARVDRICRGEGLAFLRAYLAERWDVHDAPAPVRQALVPVKYSLFRSRITLFESLVFVAGLGCSGGCSFCATSAYFQRQRVPVLGGRALYEAVRDGARRHPKVQSAVILDENFLADRAQVQAFAECMAADEELQTRPLLLTVFSSVATLAHYEVADLVRCGIGTIFIGVESFDDELLAAEQLHKRHGEDVAALFDRLHAAGIATLGSMVVGWDGHTPANVEQELARFVALRPTMYQVVPLHPVPGTPLWRRVRAEGRIVPGYRYADDGVARSNFQFRHFAVHEVHALANRTYRQLVAQGGPWPFRSFAVYLAGWRNLKDNADPLLARRAAACRKLAATVLPLALACRPLFWGRGFRRAWGEAVGSFAREFPLRTALGGATALAALPLLGALWLGGQARHWLTRHGDQPATIRREYRAAERRG